MRNRRPMKRKASKKLFTRTAKRVNPMNGSTRPMRGGFRL